MNYYAVLDMEIFGYTEVDYNNLIITIKHMKLETILKEGKFKS